MRHPFDRTRRRLEGLLTRLRGETDEAEAAPSAEAAVRESEQEPGTAAAIAERARGTLHGGRRGLGHAARRIRRQLGADEEEHPSVARDAAATAISVADAAKRTMIAAVRDAGEADHPLIHQTARDAVTGAATAGADVTAAAVGAVSGAVHAAHRLEADASAAASAAATGALVAAAELGEPASQRVREAIERRNRGLHIVDEGTGIELAPEPAPA